MLIYIYCKNFCDKHFGSQLNYEKQTAKFSQQTDRQAIRILKKRSREPTTAEIALLKIIPGGPVGTLGRDNWPAVSGLHPTVNGIGDMAMDNNLFGLATTRLHKKNL